MKYYDCSAPSYYPKQCCIAVNWTLRNNFEWNLNPNSSIGIHRNAFQNIVCWTAAILSRESSVNFRVTDLLCGEFNGDRWIPIAKASGVFFDLRLNKQLSIQPKRRWFETPSCSLWRRPDGQETASLFSCLLFLRLAAMPNGVHK